MKAGTPWVDGFVREHYIEFLKSSATIKSDRSLRDYVLSIDMFEREAGADFLETIKEYRDFHWIVEALASRTEWPDGRAKKRWSNRMVYKVASECCVFFKWAHAFKFTEWDPCKDGHQFKKSPGPIPEFFDWDDEQFKKLLHDPGNTIRMVAILHLLRASGIRASELCGLKISDVETDCVCVRNGKGGIPRYAPIDDECGRRLRDYTDDLAYHYSGPWLFPKENYSGPITAHGLWRMLYNRGRKLGIRVYPHKFRHSLGGALAERGVDCLAISEVLGHKSPQTTRLYFHLKKQKMLNIYRNAISKAG